MQIMHFTIKGNNRYILPVIITQSFAQLVSLDDKLTIISAALHVRTMPCSMRFRYRRKDRRKEPFRHEALDQ